MYGMAKMQDWYAERLDRAVMMGVCVIPIPFNTYEGSVKDYAEWEKSGF